jgi:hypothetical protein
MDMLSRDDLRLLIEHHSDPCISIFLPMERAGKETRQNAIRLKNMLRETEDRLVNAGMEAADIEHLVEPVRALLSDTIFWQHQSDGLAIFRSADLFRTYRAPLSFEELLVITDRFHIKPMLPIFTDNGHFYVLALSQNDVRLLQGTRYSVDVCELPEDTPTSLEDALATDDPEKQLQFHTSATAGVSPAASKGQSWMMHGHDDPDERVNLLRYFQEVDRGVSAVLHDRHAPLVLYGVDYLLPLYADRNSYHHLLEQGVTGNPDNLKPEEIQAHAWDVIEPYFQQQQQQAAERFHENRSKDLASGDLGAIVSGAINGRVDTLFVPVGVQQWGRFDPAANSIEVYEESRPGAQDLLDLAALHTIANSGVVYAVEPEGVPDNGHAAAIFRYPLS